MDEVQEMMKGLAIDESSFYESVDLKYEFDASYIFKIKLSDLPKNTPVKVHSPSTPKLESDKNVTPSDSSMPSPEEKTEAKQKSASNLSKQSRTFMKPTASHLAKQINNSVDIQTHTRCEIQDTKRHKLEIGFLRKAAKLEASLNSRSKTTIPRKPKLMTEERARRRRSRSEPEANIYTFKALPLNRKIFDSPSLPIHKQSMPRNVLKTQFCSLDAE
ncbi:hypothetical protein L2E82_07164 [Cichorium intybus]|uniref:Uncharacterized protein n=1 Tax=Cichorium intybus TaxID=13427 RepID=A0ACB9G4K0_CICIN|nr:hypothetical protein L2E82_07164 [Cichorium intybus]